MNLCHEMCLRHLGRADSTADSTSHNFLGCKFNEWHSFSLIKILESSLTLFLNSLRSSWLSLPEISRTQPPLTTLYHFRIRSQQCLSGVIPISLLTDLTVFNFSPHSLFLTHQLACLSLKSARVALLPRPFSGSPFHRK